VLKGRRLDECHGVASEAAIIAMGRVHDGSRDGRRTPHRRSRSLDRVRVIVGGQCRCFVEARPGMVFWEDVEMVEQSIWMRKVAADPGHSTWYVERFRSMARHGEDLDGEARFVDAMVPRRARILDAGCGPGRVGGPLAKAGHDVIGVDVDPVLIEAAEHDHPGPRWMVCDLAELDLPVRGITAPFDVIVCAGNVMPFLAPSTRGEC
jgi:hypothetical protein